MNMQDLILVINLIKNNPNINEKSFFKVGGKVCVSMPSLRTSLAFGNLLSKEVTGAIVVIHNTPIFIGDKLWYQSRHYEGFVTLTGFNATAGNKKYCFTYEGTSNIEVTEQLLHEFILLDRPKPKYSEMSFNGKSIRAISTKCTSAYPIKITDSKGNDYWADSNNTVNALGTNLQFVCDEMLEAIAAQKTVRVMLDGKPSTLITH